MRALSVLFVLLLARFGTSATHACINVDKGADADPPGEWTCFTGDELGMVCGGDGTAEESYCTADTGGVKVCARSEGGGRCADGAVPPPTQLDAAALKRKAEAQAAEDAQRAAELAEGEQLYEQGGTVQYPEGGTVQDMADADFERTEGEEGEEGKEGEQGTSSGEQAPESDSGSAHEEL